MFKKYFLYSIFLVSLAGCSSLKTAFTGKKEIENRQVIASEKKDEKFLNNISTGEENVTVSQEAKRSDVKEAGVNKPVHKENNFQGNSIEQASPLHLKYAVLLNTNVEGITNLKMFEFIDEWYGTKYRYGGTTKSGIDCSAFTQYLFAAVYSITLPRTANDQYKMTNRISRTELMEGDLIFFNTRGGISHVGIYLQNNKFVHASTSGGVMISDIFEEYWVRRFMGVGRLKEQAVIAGGN